MNRLTRQDRIAVVRALVEGCSIRSTVRMTGVAKNTILKLLVELGEACSVYQDAALRNLPCKRLQLDEIWSFVGANQKNVPEEHRGLGRGDVWTWTAIDADSKLVPSWFVGLRDGETAQLFVRDLAGRLADRVQLTTDGHKAYLEAVEQNFGVLIDYAKLVKLFGQDPQENEKRYSPAKCNGCRKEVIMGNPDPDHISTSFAERANLTMRMSMRRFTRLTNAHSKKLRNHVAAVSLHFMYYNFARRHETLRMAPAMKVGVADHLWSIEEIVSLLENQENNSN